MVEQDAGKESQPRNRAVAGLLKPMTGQLKKIGKQFRANPVGAGIWTGITLILGATISSIIGLGIEEAWTGPARAEAEARQIIIEERTGRIDEGVTTLHATLAALQSAQGEADFQAFGQEAQRLVEQIEQLSPLLEEAALQNAAQIAQLRREVLASADGVIRTSALEIARGQSVVICGGYLLAVRTSNYSKAVHLILSRHGETISQNRTRLGESIIMRTPEKTVVATVTGLSVGPNADLVGLNFDCLPGQNPAEG